MSIWIATRVGNYADTWHFLVSCYLKYKMSLSTDLGRWSPAPSPLRWRPLRWCAQAYHTCAWIRSLIARPVQKKKFVSVRKDAAILSVRQRVWSDSEYKSTCASMNGCPSISIGISGGAVWIFSSKVSIFWFFRIASPKLKGAGTPGIKSNVVNSPGSSCIAKIICKI